MPYVDRPKEVPAQTKGRKMSSARPNSSPRSTAVENMGQFVEGSHRGNVRSARNVRAMAIDVCLAGRGRKPTLGGEDFQQFGSCSANPHGLQGSKCSVNPLRVLSIDLQPRRCAEDLARFAYFDRIAW